MTAPLSRRHLVLLALLSTATFFEGYDFILLNLVLPYLQRELHLDLQQVGHATSLIAAGTIAAFFLVRLGDRLGRRAMLLYTVLGYTLATGLTALSRDLYSFVALQFVARAFLVAEWGLSTVILAEELPAERRGLGISLVQGAAGLGGIVGSAIFPLVSRAALGWRAMYLIGLVPLLLVAVLRSQLPETARFAAVRAHDPEVPGWTAVLAPAHRRTLVVLALVWFCMYLGYTPIMTFWTTFALHDRGLSQGQVSTVLAVAYSLGLTGFAAAGRLMDTWGRRPTALVFFCGGAVATSGAFLAPASVVWLGTSLLVLIFFTTGYMALCATLTAELFPTRLRASAAAWTNNTLGRLGMVLAPTLVGHLAPLLAQPAGRALGGLSSASGLGPAVAVLGAGPLLSALLVWLFLPETRGRELESIAA